MEDMEDQQEAGTAHMRVPTIVGYSRLLKVTQSKTRPPFPCRTKTISVTVYSLQVLNNTLL